ncbi:MAG: helix-turn-helix domain-containing protein [Acidobacteria bacterium]|nr:helix-turn-helix domain-containing protein [Acidobacteriota bacterium]
MGLHTSALLDQSGDTPAANLGDLLTVKDVAEILRVPVSWVYDRTRKRSIDRLPGMRLGKYWRYRREDITAWLRRQQA